MNKKITIFSIVLLVAGLAGFAYEFWAQQRAPATATVAGPLTTIGGMKITDVAVASHSLVTPSTTPDSLPLTPYGRFAADVAQAKAANTSTIVIQFFGDIMLDRNVAKAMGNKGLDYVFGKVAPPSTVGAIPTTSAGRHELPLLWGAADLTIANLEGPFAPKRVPTSKSIAFRFDPKLAKQLKDYGFDAVSLANNHTYDMGRANVAFTRQTLKDAGIGYFGDELLEGKEYTWFTEVQGQKIAFVGLHNVYRQLNMTKVKEAIKDARKNARYVIVSNHWGLEYQRLSSQQQRALARQLIDLGADAVVSHHPHVIQEMEIYKDKPIFYSLGNFIFDQYFSQDTQEGLSVGMILQDGKVKDVYVFPFYGVKSQVYAMDGKRYDGMFEWLNKNSRMGERKFEDGRLSF